MPFSMKQTKKKKNCHHKLDTRRSSRHYSIVQKQRHSLRELYGSRVPSIVHTAGGNRALNACFEVAAAAALTPKSVAPNSKQNLRKPTTQSVHLVRKRHNAVLRSTFFRRRKKSVAKTNCSTTVK